MLHAPLDLLWPIAYVLVRVKYQIRRTGHVVFSFSLAHVISCAIRLVRVVTYVAILLLTHDFICWKISSLKFAPLFDDVKI